MTYITRIATKRILVKYFLYSLKINYLHCKLSASRSVFSCYATIMFGCKANHPIDIDSGTSDGDQLLQELQSSVPSEVSIKIWLLFSGFVSSCKFFCMEVQPEYSHFCKINVAFLRAILFAK